MSDWLQVNDVKEINITHHNSKNCDGYSTIINFIKNDGTQTQITAYNKKELLLKLD